MKKKSPPPRRPRGVSRIDKLTPEQKAHFGEWRDRWIKIGLCTEPADRALFEDAVARCYKFANLEPPKRVVWVDSPIVVAFAGPIAAYVLAKGDVRSAVRSAVDSAVFSAVRSAVDSAVGSAVFSAVGSAVFSAVDSAVGSAVFSAVDSAVDSAVRSAVGSAVDSAVFSAVGSAVDSAVFSAVGSAVDSAVLEVLSRSWASLLGGQFWVGGYWYGAPAFTTFFTDVCRLRFSNDIAARAKAYQDTCSSACWWWPHRDFVIACERPRVISRDEAGRLHSETGNAIEFRDGWGLAMWHGTAVPLEWVKNRATLDPSIALTDKSVERRRAAAEMIGWSKVLASLPNKTIDTDPDPQIGKLVDVDLPDAPKSRFLLVRCATGRDFALPVPRECKTALDANAWTYDVPPVDLKNLLEGRT